MVTVLGRPEGGALEVEKSPRLNQATQFLTVAYDGVCSPNVSIRMAWISFGALPCRKKNLMTARVSVLLKSRASLVMFHFNLCNKKRLAIRHMNRLLFPTTLSIPSYDIGKSGLSAPRRRLFNATDNIQNSSIITSSMQTKHTSIIYAQWTPIIRQILLQINEELTPTFWISTST